MMISGEHQPAFQSLCILKTEALLVTVGVSHGGAISWKQNE